MFHIIISVVALVVNAFLVYFTARLLLVFKGGIMEKPWVFVALGVFALAFGASLFSIHYLLNLGNSIVHGAGGLLMVLGGVFALIGIYLQYRTWTIKA